MTFPTSEIPYWQGRNSIVLFLFMFLRYCLCGTRVHSTTFVFYFRQKRLTVVRGHFEIRNS